MTAPSLQAQHDAFEAYKAARAKVDQTLDFEDARAAGAAWLRFLDLLDAGSAAAGATGTVVPFRRRGPLPA